MTDINSKCKLICIGLKEWLKKSNYKGIDPYFLDEKIFKQAGKWGFLKVLRKLAKPFHSWIPPQIFKKFSPRIIAGGLSMIIEGNCSFYGVTSEAELIKENYKLVEFIKRERYKSSQYLCWGWPFEWGGGRRVPVNYPLVCVSSPIGIAFLDFYGIVQDKMVLGFAQDIAKFLTLENGYQEFKEGVCFYYSKLSKELVLNANAWAGIFLLTLGRIINSTEYYRVGEKAIKFVVDSQNADGSWYYSSRFSKPFNPTIDSRHTSSLLQCLKKANRILQQERIEISIRQGWKFYRRKLFADGIPKHDLNSQTYPCDIHDVGLAIATATEFRDFELAEHLVRFAIEKFSNGKDEFYYKLFANGRVNRTVFIRWNQTCMYRGLTFFLKEKDRLLHKSEE